MVKMAKIRDVKTRHIYVIVRIRRSFIIFRSRKYIVKMQAVKNAIILLAKFGKTETWQKTVTKYAACYKVSVTLTS